MIAAAADWNRQRYDHHAPPPRTTMTKTILCQAEAYSLSGPVFNARIAAGWTLEGDDSGNHWHSPTLIHESEWEAEGWPLPEDQGYAAFITSRPDLAA